MKQSFTISHLEALQKSGRIRGFTLPEKAPEKKKSKYGNSKTEVEGIRFDSIREANRYKVLIQKRKHGLIGQLELQVPYELNPGGTHSLKYIADFVYIDAETGKKVVEDSKGHRTREYLKKRRLMLKVHGIEIYET